jgi:predicted TIM-barrel fold metal-dependent hydrolase
MSRVDLSHAEVVDAHCHPFRVSDLLDRDPATFETRCMLLGTALLSSKKIDQQLWAVTEALSDSTLFALSLRRWLAAYLHCAATKVDIARARNEALRADPVAYTRGLLEDERISAVIADEGHPQPTIPREDFEAALGGITVHRVGRIEPWIIEARQEERFDDVVGRFEQMVVDAASDNRLIGFKTIIAYRTGLDVENPSSVDAAAAFDRWRADAWAETRENAKPVRDLLLRRALSLAREHDRVFHVHVGGGDPDINLAHAKPRDVFPLLVEHQKQPILLIHSGYPWIAEAAYVASVLPNVYLEISELVPWGWGRIDTALQTILGTVPAAKVLHGSDEASEPEVIWASARLVRESLERVLERFLERDYLSPDDADRLGRAVLATNVRTLHGV